MYPELFNICGIPIFSYGFFLALGFILATYSLVETGKRFNLNNDHLMDLAIYALISGIVGARLLYIIINFPYYIQNPLEIIMINRGGLVFYGGFIASVITCMYYIRSKKMPFLTTGDCIMAVLPIGQMFGRIGCFMNGCCFGSPSVLPFRVTFPITSHAFYHYQEFTPVHPVQLYESLLTGLLFLFLVTIIERKKFDGQIIALYGMLYPIIRFLLEFLRGDNDKILTGLTMSQFISIVIFIISASIYRYLSLERKKSARI
ncbi:MAG: phosphatidylglycerol-prolipoprotein diacylglyceryl transferase [uncultured bacterium]|nr:MAG: phosphatidylglycerol-prolipoprotein diacylglyceryl transferase [uncultured bacterium]